MLITHKPCRTGNASPTSWRCSFSAKPAVNLRPTGSGLEVVVLYITRAPQRNETKSKLFQLIVDLMHKPATS